jgi:Na+-transporting methylmalonyl-CoA/oxaloacetate decarboxylase gamma subunit
MPEAMMTGILFSLLGMAFVVSFWLLLLLVFIPPQGRG